MQMVKTVKRYGNSGGVYVPRRWIGGSVKVELIEEPLNPKKDLLMLPLEHVVCAILYGSYARKEAVEGSDIDMLLIVDDKSKVAVPEKLRRKYDIQVKSAGEIRNAVVHDPVLYKIVKDEAVAVINSQFLDSLKEETPDKKGIKTRISLLESSLAIASGMLKADMDCTDLAYPLVMRLKEALIIECLLTGKKYSTKMLERDILNAGLKKPDLVSLMEIYRAARSNKKSPKLKLQKETASKLISMLEKKIKYVSQKAREKGY